MSDFGPLVDTHWLGDHLGEHGLKIIDGSWRMPGNPPARSDFRERHLKNAVFFDIDAVADHASNLPHMAPTAAQFEMAMGEMGISHSDKVVIYDDRGCFSAARVWWTFRLMGHPQVAVLDGGLPKWVNEDRPVTNAVSTPNTNSYQASHHPSLLCDAQHLRQCIHNNNTLILDARPAARFDGEAPEPRQGLRSGAMPNATNLPIDALFNEDKTFLDKNTLATLLAQSGVLADKATITTCGSGITAAVLSLALDIIGHMQHQLYDGSWAEWGNTQNDEKEFPVVSAKQ